MFSEIHFLHDCSQAIKAGKDLTRMYAECLNDFLNNFKFIMKALNSIEVYSNLPFPCFYVDSTVEGLIVVGLFAQPDDDGRMGADL